MKKIFLTQGYYTTVDDDIYDVIGKWNWFILPSKLIIYAATAHKSYKLHHYVIGRPLNNLIVDHIDGNGLNNQRKNLRIVTNRQNCAKRSTSNAPYPGIIFYVNRYVAQIRVAGKNEYLGRYKDPLDAFTAYRKAVIDLGEELLPEHEDMWRRAINVKTQF